MCFASSFLASIAVITLLCGLGTVLAVIAMNPQRLDNGLLMFIVL